MTGGARAFEQHLARLDLLLACQRAGCVRLYCSGNRRKIRDVVSEIHFIDLLTRIDVEARIASDVDTDLQVDGGAGEFIIDLRDVRVTNADINVGAAQLTVTLPKPTTAVTIDVNAGASSITIEVPDGVEAQVTTKGALLTLRSSNSRVKAATCCSTASAARRDSASGPMQPAWTKARAPKRRTSMRLKPSTRAAPRAAMKLADIGTPPASRWK